MRNTQTSEKLKCEFQPPNKNKVSFEPRWYVPGTGPPVAAKVYISSEELKAILLEQLSGKLSSDFNLYCGDGEYYCPPVGDASDIVRSSGLARRGWVAEKFDCDDFAHVLKGHFSEAAYKDGRRRKPHCFGIVWGNLPTPHAVNWMINRDLKLRFVEPQSNRIYFPRVDDHQIWLMLT